MIHASAEMNWTIAIQLFIKRMINYLKDNMHNHFQSSIDISQRKNELDKIENPGRAFSCAYYTLALIILCSPPSHAHDAHDARPGDQSARRMKGKEIKFSPLPSSSRQRSASLQQSLYFETLSTFSFQYIIRVHQCDWLLSTQLPRIASGLYI